MGRIWTPGQKRLWGTFLIIWGLIWLRTFSPGRGAILLLIGGAIWLSAVKEERSGKDR